MAASEQKLMVFAALGPGWTPCGQLTLTEEGPNVLASSFASGLNYVRRADALEVDPVSLGLKSREEVRGKRLLPANNLITVLLHHLHRRRETIRFHLWICFEEVP